MARKRIPHPTHLFDMPEIAAGSALTVLHLESLMKRSDAPEPVSGGGRGKGALLFDSYGLAIFGVAGGLFWSGAELTPSIRIAKALVSELRSQKGYVPSGIAFAWRDVNGEAKWPKADDDFLLFEVYREHGTQNPTNDWKGDYVLEVFNREYCFIDNYDSQIEHVPSFGVDRKSSSIPNLRLFGWKRGGDVSISDPSYGIPVSALDSDATEFSKANARAIEDEFYAARANPLGSLRLNVSRAIRCAYARVFDWRLTHPPNTS